MLYNVVFLQGALLGLVAVAEALSSGQKDLPPDDGDLMKPGKEAAGAIVAAASASSSGDGRKSDAELVAALPVRLLPPAKAAGLTVAALVLDRIAASTARALALQQGPSSASGGGSGGAAARTSAGSRGRRLEAVHLRTVELYADILGRYGGMCRMLL